MQGSQRSFKNPLKHVQNKQTTCLLTIITVHTYIVVGRSYIVASRRSTWRSAVTTTHLHDFRTLKAATSVPFADLKEVGSGENERVFPWFTGFSPVFLFNECMNGYIPWKCNMAPEKLPGPNRNVAFQPPIFSGVCYTSGLDAQIWILATLGIPCTVLVSAHFPTFKSFVACYIHLCMYIFTCLFVNHIPPRDRRPLIQSTRSQVADSQLQ